MQVIKCSQCDKSFRVPPEMVGKRVRCPNCKSPTDTIAGEEQQPQLPSSVASVKQQETVQVGASQPTMSVLAGRRRSGTPVWVFVAGAVVIAGLIGVTVWLVNRPNKKRSTPAPQTAKPNLQIVPVVNARCSELTQLQIQLKVRDAQGEVSYRLVDGPAGMTVSPTGALAWTPNEIQGPGKHSVTVEARDTSGKGRAQRSFSIDVAETNSSPVIAPIKSVAAPAGAPFRLQVKATDPDSPAQELTYSLKGDTPKNARIHPRTGVLVWTPSADDVSKIVRFTIHVEEQQANGLAAQQSVSIRVDPPRRSLANKKPPGNTPPTTPQLETTPRKSPTDSAGTDPKTKPSDGWSYVEAVTKLYRDKNLLRRNDYERLRAVEAKRIWLQHEAALRAGMGEEFEPFVAWLNEAPKFREELLIALSAHDDVTGVMRILDELRDKFPDKVLPYGNLAIATSVVWDNPKAVYDYGRHQRRAKASMPPGAANAMDNFEYILGTERFMSGRGRWLPWEFLTHVVNHKTPANERQWALQNYVSKRAMFGRCYKDVPYDTEMLNSKSQVARLNGKVYNLPNLKGFGGVCAHQADYASRVGKSIGVPAAYVRGPSRSGSYHAWVMWVELKSVTERSIGFTLESFGRYQLDKYYVGTLLEPQSGKRITDRQLELRLQTVGLDAQAKRHADLLMRAYPHLKERLQWDTSERFRYISQVIKSCPGSEAAWIELSKMAGEDVVREKHRKQMINILDQLFVTFANFPRLHLDGVRRSDSV